MTDQAGAEREWRSLGDDDHTEECFKLQYGVGEVWECICGYTELLRALVYRQAITIGGEDVQSTARRIHITDPEGGGDG